MSLLRAPSLGACPAAGRRSFGAPTQQHAKPTAARTRNPKPKLAVFSTRDGGPGGKGGGEGSAGLGSASELVSQMQRDAITARTAQRLSELRALKEQERGIQTRAAELEKEMVRYPVS
jgi:hypothetical protein